MNNNDKVLIINASKEIEDYITGISNKGKGLELLTKEIYPGAATFKETIDYHINTILTDDINLDNIVNIEDKEAQKILIKKLMFITYLLGFGVDIEALATMQSMLSLLKSFNDDED